MNKYIKLIISFLLIISAIYLFNQREAGWGVFFIISSLLFIFLFFRNEFLLLAFFRIRKQDMKGLEKWLKYIKNPTGQLIKSQEAYYYFLNGVLLNTTGGKVSQIENYMNKAINTGLFFNHDKAMAYLNLAICSLAKGKKRQAELFLLETKKLDRSGILNEQRKMVKEQIKRMGIKQNINNPHIRKRAKH